MFTMYIYRLSKGAGKEARETRTGYSDRNNAIMVLKDAYHRIILMQNVLYYNSTRVEFEVQQV